MKQQYLAIGVNFEQGYTNSSQVTSERVKTVLHQMCETHDCDADCWNEILLVDRELNVVKLWRRSKGQIPSC